MQYKPYSAWVVYRLSVRLVAVEGALELAVVEALVAGIRGRAWGINQGVAPWWERKPRDIDLMYVSQLDSSSK